MDVGAPLAFSTDIWDKHSVTYKVMLNSTEIFRVFKGM